jgi:hypothetical protein
MRKAKLSWKAALAAAGKDPEIRIELAGLEPATSWVRSLICLSAETT